MGGMLAWVAWVACLRGLHASDGSVGGMLVWVMWVLYVYVFTCVLFRFDIISQITN